MYEGHVKMRLQARDAKRRQVPRSKVRATMVRSEQERVLRLDCYVGCPSYRFVDAHARTTHHQTLSVDGHGVLPSPLLLPLQQLALLPPLHLLLRLCCRSFDAHAASRSALPALYSSPQ